MIRLQLLLALAFAVAACFVACGCGAVQVVEQLDAAADVFTGDGAADSEGETTDAEAPSPHSDGAIVDAAAADVGPSCSWECRAFCDCGPLPCCRSAGAADCCSR